MKQNVLITGASRGIGAACAMRFAREGCRVFVNYRTEEARAVRLCGALREAGAEAFPLRADVSSGAQVAEMFAEAERLGGVDILVNNAGIAQQKLFPDITEPEWDRMFDVNVKGVYLCCKHALPPMIRKKSGSIVNLSSMWGITGASCEVHYSAAKAAVIGLTKALAKEVGPSGVRVNCVAPGAVATEMNASLSEDTLALLREETPLGALGTPDAIAEAVFFLASPASGFTTGQVLSPNGGLVI